MVSKKKYQYVSSFFPHSWLPPPAPGEENSKEASCPRFTSYNQTEWDPWCCVNRDEMAISSSLLARFQGASFPPLPPPRIVGRPVWLSLEQWNKEAFGEVAGTCLTEIAVMNQARNYFHPSSLHKYPWARSRVLPHRSPCWGRLLGSWKKCAGGGGWGREDGLQHLSSGRGKGLARSGLGKRKAFP